ncbi:MAG: hypothetical protein ACYC2G_02920 [Gemmatimonadaceae bacterium]
MPRSGSPLLPRLRLLAALILAALQMGRSGVEWLDDARFSGSPPVVVHIEETGGPGHGTPPHSLDCAICTAVATPVLPSAAAVVLPVVATRPAAIPVSVTPPADAATGYLPPARAPPLA